MLNSGGPLQARDPIPQFRSYCLDNGILTNEAIKAIQAEVDQEVEDAVTYADESPKPVLAPTSMVLAHASDGRVCAPALLSPSLELVESLRFAASTSWMRLYQEGLGAATRRRQTLT